MGTTIRLTGARVALNATRAEQIDLLFAGGRILPFGASGPAAIACDLSGHLLLPGLINAHDHLEFNLWPRPGAGPWPNARAWAEEIYQPDCALTRAHRAVPRPVRLIWGGIKNLVSGVTTVSHHNPYESAVFNAGFPVRVIEKFGWAHSLDFCRDIVERWRRTPSGWPFIVHAAEGTDERARDEIRQLEAMGVIDDRSLLVHAVGATVEQLRCVQSRGASIVWCPGSNLFTLGRTLDAPSLLSSGNLCLGTDSALTNEGDMIDEIATAKGAANLPAEEIYPLVTCNPARALRLDTGAGAIEEWGSADLIAVRDQAQTPAEALNSLRCEMVMIGGSIMLLSTQSTIDIPDNVLKGMHELHIEGRGSYWVRADVPALFDTASSILGGELRLAGKRVCR